VAAICPAFPAIGNGPTEAHISQAIPYRELAHTFPQSLKRNALGFRIRELLQEFFVLFGDGYNLRDFSCGL
jgi:hypothetical protein